MQFLKTFAQRFRQQQRLARAAKPVIEGLEERRLFAAGYGLWPGPNDTIIDFNGGAVRFAPNLHAGSTWLVVCGTDDADTIKITPAGNGGKDWLVEINGQSQVFTDPTGQGVRGLEIDGYGGDDHLELNVTSANLNGTFLMWNDVWGGDGNDTIIGADVDSWGADDLYGDGGNDTIYGRGGADQIEGGSGNDVIDGGAGADTIWGDGYGGGGSPDDTIDGGAGADDVNGVHEQQVTSWDVYLGGVQLKYRASDETNVYGTLFISGTVGDDNVRLSVDPNDANKLVITANGQSHSVAASNLADSLFLWIGTDDGDDVIDLSLSAADMNTFGFANNYGRAEVRPGHGDDVVLGSGAADYIVAGYGRDTVHAGGGDDVVELHYGLYSDVHGGDGNDTITATDSYAFDPVTRRILDHVPGTEMLYGDDGTDTINGVVEPADPEPLPEEELQESMSEAVLPFVGPMQPDVYAAWMTAQQGIMGGEVGTDDVNGAPTPAMLNWAPPVSSNDDDALSTWAEEHEDDDLVA